MGYWQQRVRYEIVATLDERRGDGVLRAAGRLTYVNASPDTLRELYFHQYLNAFRPGSRWSAADEREGVVRFQRLRDPDYAYERFTAAPTVDGTPVRAEYPGAPDSTVVRLVLPRPLPPGDSVRVGLAWDARLSTVPRRQGRRGRSYDFAHWYPKVAVYDRGAWQPNALEPRGEFYGEFGEFDVTLVLASDQVVGATGVPVEGDPGWTTVLRSGGARPSGAAYGAAPSPALPRPAVPDGHRAVRFVARDVHHFGWSVSPDYRYEGGVYVRGAGVARTARVPGFDTVSVHVLYRPGDEREWGGGQVLVRTQRALAWLEGVYGAYAYPQMTVLHRIEGGGTEFPMLQMNGSPSYGLNLHEGGHNFVQGILANNEWQSPWMDEALTDYLARWAQDVTRHDRLRLGTWPRAGDPPRQRGYYARALIPPPDDLTPLDHYRLDLSGRAQPIATRADRFREYRVYAMVASGRAQMMFGALRDVVGDSAFVAFLHDYYARWALRHVDERALRAAAERASGRELGWFFDQWLHRTGLIDYELGDVRVERDAAGWVTRVRARRVGDYRHPVPVGVRTPGAGWTVVRGDPLADAPEVVVRTTERPLEVRLDPHLVTDDWYRPNDVAPSPLWWRGARTVFDWPLLDQYHAARQVVALTPLVWYGDAGGPTVAVRARSNYQLHVDRRELGLAFSTRVPGRQCAPLEGGAELCTGRSAWHSGVQGWLVAENPIAAPRHRPAMGVRAGVWRLDGLTKLEAAKRWDVSRFAFARGRTSAWTLGYTGSYAYDAAFIDSARWSGEPVHDVSLGYATRSPGADGTRLRLAAAGGVFGALGDEGGQQAPLARRTFARIDGEVGRRAEPRGGALALSARGFAAWSVRAPAERAVYAAAASPTETFDNHLLRARGAPLADSEAHYVALGGAGLRGYSPRLAAPRIASVNLEAAARTLTVRRIPGAPRLYAGVFADVAARPTNVTGEASLLADAGAGLSLRGRLYDREVRLRLDLPLYVRQAGLSAAPGGRALRRETALRWVFSTRDLW